MAYPGGKAGSGVYQTIINLIPPHDVYIEPFLGAGSIMRLKRPAARSIGIDNDSAALEAFSATYDDAAGVTLRNADAFGFLEKHPFTGREFVYCDPPYLHETRVNLKLYRDELAPADHARLLDILKALPCMVMISGYWSQMYAQALAGWHTASFQAMTRGGTMATEWLWMNYPPPQALHDYRYLGADYRERERIKRKITREKAKLHALPALERQALLSALRDEWPDLTSSQMPVLQASPDVAGADSDIATHDDVGRHRQKRRA